MRALLNLFVVLIILLSVTACAILQGDSQEKRAQAFMAQFQKALNSSDLEVLQLFESDQTRDALLSAIDILQNNDTTFVRCRADFSAMKIEPAPALITEMAKANVMKVRLPATFQPTVTSSNPGDTSSLTLWLLEKDKSFVIASMEATGFYNRFTSIKHDIQYANHMEEELKKREETYALALKLQEKYDSVVWYARYNQKTYFYVVKGTWNENYLYPQSKEVKPEYQMGLIDENGKVIVPVAFDLIGTLGSVVANAVEVKAPGGYGYFSLSGDTLISPEYDQIIPYPDNGGWIVQNYGALGWVDDNGKYSENLPSKSVDEYVKSFAFLPAHITINEANYALCESPRQEGAGSGAFIAPSYWVGLGICDQVRFGLTTTATDAPIGGWTEYSEVSNSLFEKISDNVSLLVVHFKERYLEGREEFYETNRAILTDNNLRALEQDNTVDGFDFAIKKLAGGIVELVCNVSYSDMYYGGTSEYNRYKYFQLVDGGSAASLTSKRNYPQSEFAYLDSTYLAGTFNQIVGEEQRQEVSHFMPVDEMHIMRNEILKTYELAEEHGVPRPYTRAELPNLTDIDFYNVNFLARMIIASSDQTEGDI